MNTEQNLQVNHIGAVFLWTVRVSGAPPPHRAPLNLINNDEFFPLVMRFPLNHRAVNGRGERAANKRIIYAYICSL